MANWSNSITIAIDDVDSPTGGCTTHFTGLLLHTLSRKPDVEILDYPLLVRLNPSIPWKTRGNAATVIRLRGIESSEALDLVTWLINEYTLERPREPGKGPGVVIVEGYPWKHSLRKLYRAALTGVVTRDTVEKAINSVRGLVWGSRGVIGAASAVAALAPWDDYTFELIFYRRPELWGKPRCVKPASEAHMPPCTFNNSLFNTAVAAPRGPDPVLAGFRGDCPRPLFLYSEWLCEDPHFWVLYRSNQHTDAPVTMGDPRRPYPYNYYYGWATVSGIPRRLPGGHVIVEAVTGGVKVTLSFYREAWPLNKVSSLLAPGDKIWIMGSVRPYGIHATIAVDKMRVSRLARTTRKVAPSCPVCGHRMKSAGKGRGYRCPRCGYHDQNIKPLLIEEPRLLSPGWYAPRDGRIRHLVAPPNRMHANKTPVKPSWTEIMGVSLAPVTHS